MIELNQEIEMIKRITSYIDELLAGASFKRADTLVLRRAEQTAQAKTMPAEKPSIKVIRSRSGAVLATLTYTKDEARFQISPDLELRRDDKPFSSFLLRKVLEAMSRDDEERVRLGELDREKMVKYEIVYDGDRVSEILVKNYRDEARLKDLINSVRWTLETVSGR
jgi:hypothetical protein